MAAPLYGLATRSSTAKAFYSYISRPFSSASTSNSETAPVFARNSSSPLRQGSKDRNGKRVFLGCPGVGKGTDALASQMFMSIMPQEILEGVTDIDLVINLKLREQALIAKCLGRRICSECGENYNIACIDINGENGKPGIYMAPLPPPQNCASKLILRSDDTEEVVKERLRVYYEMSQPIEEFHHSRGKLLEFDLPGGIPESWPKLLQALNLEVCDYKHSAAA